MPRTINRFWRRLGFRGSALLFFFVLDEVFAFSYFKPPPEVRLSAGLKFVDSVAPLWFWGALWAAVGLVCLLFAFRTRDKVAFAAAIGIKILWGGLYIVGAFTANLERAYVSAGLWLCIAGFVGIIAAWPEPSRTQVAAPPAKEG